MKSDNMPAVAPARRVARATRETVKLARGEYNIEPKEMIVCTERA